MISFNGGMDAGPKILSGGMSIVTRQNAGEWRVRRNRGSLAGAPFGLLMVIFPFQLSFLLARTSDLADSEAPPQPVALGHGPHASDGVVRDDQQRQHLEALARPRVAGPEDSH